MKKKIKINWKNFLLDFIVLYLIAIMFLNYLGKAVVGESTLDSTVFILTGFLVFVWNIATSIQIERRVK